MPLEEVLVHCHIREWVAARPRSEGLVFGKELGRVWALGSRALLRAALCDRELGSWTLARSSGNASLLARRTFSQRRPSFRTNCNSNNSSKHSKQYKQKKLKPERPSLPLPPPPPPPRLHELNLDPLPPRRRRKRPQPLRHLRRRCGLAAPHPRRQHHQPEPSRAQLLGVPQRRGRVACPRPRRGWPAGSGEGEIEGAEPGREAVEPDP